MGFKHWRNGADGRLAAEIGDTVVSLAIDRRANGVDAASRFNQLSKFKIGGGKSDRSPELRALWEKELGEMRVRIKAMRQKLVDGLKAAGVTKDMSFITTQIGMFSYSGLSKDQMVRLRTEFGVYGTDTGRMCVAALNSKNIDYVCQAIAKVI